MHSATLRTSDLQKTVLKLGFGFILGLCSFAEDSGKENGSYFNGLDRAWVLEDCWVRQFLWVPSIYNTETWILRAWHSLPCK